MRRTTAPTNDEIAGLLERVAELLEAQRANPFRVRAYRRAAHMIERLEQPIAEIAKSEEERLEDLSDIGRSIAGSIREYVHTERLGLLDRLEGQVSPEDLFTTVPGVGEELARRIHDALHIETLEDLEMAAHDGRLADVPGVGERRLRGIRDSVAAILNRSSRRRARRLHHADSACGQTHDEDLPAHPSTSCILAVDAEYRHKAEDGLLPTIVPRRFNPGGQAALPILHVDRNGWSFTALFSNSARAHALGKTRDWVVVYYERHGHENQCTVVTEYHGPLRGRRTVRGREDECAEYYRGASGGVPPPALGE